MPIPLILRRAYAALPAGLVRFLAVGVLGLATNLGLLLLLERAGLAFGAALAVALLAATLVTWLLNRAHTFAASGRAAHHEGLRYFAVALVAQSVNWGVATALVDVFAHLPHGVCAFAGAVVATLFSYTGHRFFTFASAESDAAAPAAAPVAAPGVD